MKSKRTKRYLKDLMLRSLASAAVGLGLWLCSTVFAWGMWSDMYVVFFGFVFICMSLDLRRPKHQRRARVQKVRRAAPSSAGGSLGLAGN